ncbi:MAG: hypothetical protein RLZZ330_901 [Actinomycetota bacterium]
MKTKLAVAAISAACFGYLLIAGIRGLQFNGTDSVTAKIFAISIFIISAISIALILREILFGIRISRMSTILEAESLLLRDDLPSTPSGQTDKVAADARFELISKEVEDFPESWRAWFRVALAYDESRDRKRARFAMRQAEKFFRAEFKSNSL